MCEQNPHYLLRDTRPLLKRFTDFFVDPFNVMITLFTLGGVPLFFPEVADISGFLAIVLFACTFKAKAKLPFRLPMRCGLIDYNDIAPGGNKPRKAGGI